MEQFRGAMVEVEGAVVMVEMNRIVVINVVVYRVVSVKMVGVINVKMVDPEVVEVAIRVKERVREILYICTT